jgi:hypothetical protein
VDYGTGIRPKWTMELELEPKVDYGTGIRTKEVNYGTRIRTKVDYGTRIRTRSGLWNWN